VQFCKLLQDYGHNDRTSGGPFKYQQVNILGPFQTSLRFIPVAAAGFSVDVIAGYAMGRTPGQMLILLGLSGTMVCANIGLYSSSCVTGQFQTASLIFTLTDVDSSYWVVMFLVMMFVGE
jgi:hypothetical protein